MAPGALCRTVLSWTERSYPLSEPGDTLEIGQGVQYDPVVTVCAASD